MQFYPLYRLRQRKTIANPGFQLEQVCGLWRKILALLPTAGQYLQQWHCCWRISECMHSQLWLDAGIAFSQLSCRIYWCWFLVGKQPLQRSVARKQWRPGSGGMLLFILSDLACYQSGMIGLQISAIKQHAFWTCIPRTDQTEINIYALSLADQPWWEFQTHSPSLIYCIILVYNEGKLCWS